MPFNLSGYDELNKATYSVAVAYSRAVLRNSGKEVQSHLDLPSSYFVLDPLLEKSSLQMEYEVSGSNYRGITNDSVQHEITFFDSYSSFVAKAKMNITPIYCRPGYVYDGKRACKCDVNHTSIERWEYFLVFVHTYDLVRARTHRHLHTLLKEGVL